MDRNGFINTITDLTLKLKNNEINTYQYWTTLQHNTFINDLSSNDDIIIVQYNGIGDGLLLSGFIRLVRKNNPNNNIILICNESFKELYQYCPYINSLISVKCRNVGLADALLDIIDICKKHFWYHKAQLILAPQWGRPNIMASITANLVGGNRRIGYNLNCYAQCYNPPQYFYNDPINYDFLLTDNLYSPNNIIHNIDRKRYILEYLQYQIDEYKLEAWLDVNDYSNIIDKDNLIAIGLGGSLACKRYPPYLLALALKQILKIYPCTFLFIGGNDCISAASYIINTINNGINCCGKFNLRESLAQMSKCRLYIGNDTITSHMASVYNLPIINIVMEAEDKINDCPAHLSSVQQFKPISDIVKIIQPKQSAGKCKIAHIHGGCMYDHPHCITQIKPSEIVSAFIEIKEML